MKELKLHESFQQDSRTIMKHFVNEWNYLIN